MKKKPFLDSELKIQQLSEMMSISSHQLSQLINEQLGLELSGVHSHISDQEAERFAFRSNLCVKNKILSIALM